MNSLIKSNSLAVRKESSASDLAVSSASDIAVTNRASDITVTNGPRGGQVVRVRSKELTICGNKRMVDPYELMRMIRNVTQTIGEYKSSDNAFGDFIVSALRKARHDMVNQLSEHFHIYWGLGDDGKTYFYM